MSQRECAGFNGAPFSIPAGQPICNSPKAVSRAATGDDGWHGSIALRKEPLSCPFDLSLFGTVRGVGYGAKAINA